jgi:hypothetical protein
MKPGTKIVLKGFPSMGGFPAVPPESATVARWNVEINGHRMDGWEIVKFRDGGKLCVHVSRFDLAVQ